MRKRKQALGASPAWGFLEVRAMMCQDPSMPPARVIFACVHNAGRSQMAAALFNTAADRSRAEAISAGTAPAAHVHPVVVDSMRELGVDLSGAQPQLLTAALAADAALLVTMGCGESCPVIPGVRRDDWPLADPKDQGPEAVRAIREDIRTRVAQLISAEGWNP